MAISFFTLRSVESRTVLSAQARLDMAQKNLLRQVDRVGRLRAANALTVAGVHRLTTTTTAEKITAIAIAVETLAPLATLPRLGRDSSLPSPSRLRSWVNRDNKGDEKCPHRDTHIARVVIARRSS